MILSTIFPDRDFSLVDFCGVRAVDLQEALSKFPNTFTAYAEDRKSLWSATYLQWYPQVIHLGRDIQVPAGTVVRSPVDGIVDDIWFDTDTDLGWGTRVDILTNNYRCILGHLMNVSLRVGKAIRKGDVIGVVGDRMHNGNCFEHLHLQTCINPYPLADDSRRIDGYGGLEDLKYHFDPFNL
jgi:hypothetical protein